MDKGERIMATPEGVITSTETWSGQAPAGSAEELDAIIDDLIAKADAEEVVQDLVQVLEEPEDDFDPEQV
jgi:hypothetical protein